VSLHLGHSFATIPASANNPVLFTNSIENARYSFHSLPRDGAAKRIFAPFFLLSSRRSIQAWALSFFRPAYAQDPLRCFLIFLLRVVRRVMRLRKSFAPPL